MWRDIIAAVIAAQVTITPVQHQHPPEHVELHEKFYSNWMMPDYPSISCCSNRDCAPAEAKIVNGTWYAKRDTDKKWRKVPDSKVEINRDSPDGRSHLCAPMSEPDGVFCFIPGSGS